MLLPVHSVALLLSYVFQVVAVLVQSDLAAVLLLCPFLGLQQRVERPLLSFTVNQPLHQALQHFHR